MPFWSKYIILDAARMADEIDTAKSINKNFASLYRGKSEEYLSTVAPYLFNHNNLPEFEQWYFGKGWGDSWGVLVYTLETMKYLHKHFRKFLMVKTEDGEELYFRFYDPRVLRIFLTTCDRQQLKEFFGPVDYFICEDENPAFGFIYSLDNGLLKTESATMEDVMRFDPAPAKKKFTFF